MSIWVMVGLTALVATGVMTGTLLYCDYRHYSKTDLFWPLAGLFSNQTKKVRTYGIIAHTISGFFFTCVYLGTWSIFQIESFYVYVALGFATGVIHGLIVGLGLIPVLFDQGLPGFRAGLTQALAHANFGVAVGICAALISLRPDSFDKISHAFNSTLELGGL